MQRDALMRIALVGGVLSLLLFRSMRVRPIDVLNPNEYYW